MQPFVPLRVLLLLLLLLLVVCQLRHAWHDGVRARATS
jgi:hypothetical protein